MKYSDSILNTNTNEILDIKEKEKEKDFKFASDNKGRGNSLDDCYYEDVYFEFYDRLDDDF